MNNLNEEQYFNIIMGDWNTKVRNSTEDSDVMGPFGIGKVNTDRE